MLRPHIKIYRCHPDAKIPVRATKGSAFYDLYATEGYQLIEPGHQVVVRTGLVVEIRPGWFMDVRDRSGMAKRGMRMINAPAVIDSDYRGELVVILRNEGHELQQIEKGDRIAQAQLFPCPAWIKTEVTQREQLSDTARAVGGFGSTGT